MPKSNENIKKVQPSVNYLEPIPVDSFIRHKMLRLLIKNGLEDFQSQILLSIILHGGQIKPITLAKDILCNPPRLELPDGFPSLLSLNLITMSHTRPKTAILALEIDLLLKRLATRTLLSNTFANKKDALDIIFRLDKYTFKDDSNYPEEFDNFSYFLNYYNKLDRLSFELPSLPSLLFFIFSSLWMNSSDALVLSKLIAVGGKISKKEFFLNHIKDIDPEDLCKNSKLIKADLRKLEYTNKEIKDFLSRSDSFYSHNTLKFKFSSEQQLNMTINSLHDFCQSTSMGEKSGKRKFRNLTLIKSLSKVAEALNLVFTDFQENCYLEIQTLKSAYSNVKLIDGEIFLSTIADPSSTRKRLETDIKYAYSISLVILHPYFLEDILLKIFDSENTKFSLRLLVSSEEKDLFVDNLLIHKIGIEGKRGILDDDTITFVPSDVIPQDILIGNTVILKYEIVSSMISVHEEITKENPTEINTISNDVELAYKTFNKILESNKGDTKSIKTLVNEGGK